MAVERDNEAERQARIDMILEELRLNCEDLHELSKQARERAIRMREENRVLSDAARARRRRLGKKR